VNDAPPPRAYIAGVADFLGFSFAFNPLTGSRLLAAPAAASFRVVSSRCEERMSVNPAQAWQGCNFNATSKRLLVDNWLISQRFWHH